MLCAGSRSRLNFGMTPILSNLQITRKGLRTNTCGEGVSILIPVRSFNHFCLLNLRFYEGRDGWWQYDESSGFEIESAYNQLLTKVELLIAGQLYMVDFSRMIQYQKNSVSKRRRIKRDLICVPKKGVAGLKISCCPIPKDPSSSFTTIEKNSPDEVLVPTNSNSSDTLELSLLNLTISKD